MPANEHIPEARYVYREINPSFSVSSVSHHTLTAMDSKRLLIIGGRKDKCLEVRSWESSLASRNTGDRRKSLPYSDWPGSLAYQNYGVCSLVNELLEEVNSCESHWHHRAIAGCTDSWRGHTVVPGIDGVFVTGGQSYNALVHGALEAAYLLNFAEKNAIRIFKLGKINHPRSYAATGLHHKDGTAWMHGGLGPGNRTMSTLLQLQKE